MPENVCDFAVKSRMKAFNSVLLLEHPMTFRHSIELSGATKIRFINNPFIKHLKSVKIVRVHLRVKPMFIYYRNGTMFFEYI